MLCYVPFLTLKLCDALVRGPESHHNGRFDSSRATSRFECASLSHDLAKSLIVMFQKVHLEWGFCVLSTDSRLDCVDALPSPALWETNDSAGLELSRDLAEVLL